MTKHIDSMLAATRLDARVFAGPTSGAVPLQ